MKKILLTAFFTLVLSSCALMLRLGSAGAGAAAGGAIGGPAGAAIGAVTGLATAEVTQAEDATEEVQEELDQANDIIEQLTEGDVKGIVEDQTKGLSDKIYEEVMGWIKLAVVLIIVFIVGNFLYILKRKGYAKRYYEKIDRIIGEDVE